MKKFLIRLTVFILLNLIPYFVLAYFPLRYHYTVNTISETESNLLIMPERAHYDFVVMGTSHARIFSRSGNQDRVEALLSKKFLNISEGGGHGGIFAEQMYAQWFYNRGNSTPTIVYFIDPWVFYSRKWNEENYYLQNEPLDLKFFIQNLKAGVNQDVLVNYLKTKIYPSWFNSKPLTDLKENTGSLRTVDPHAVKERIDSLYLDGENSTTVEFYQKELERSLDVAKAHNSKVIFIVPASLLGILPGQKDMVDFLKSLQRTYDVEVYDFSGALKDTKYFYDHDHLNTEGVLLFTEKYLKPLLH